MKYKLIVESCEAEPVTLAGNAYMACLLGEGGKIMMIPSAYFFSLFAEEKSTTTWKIAPELVPLGSEAELMHYFRSVLRATPSSYAELTRLVPFDEPKLIDSAIRSLSALGELDAFVGEDGTFRWRLL